MILLPGVAHVWVCFPFCSGNVKGEGLYGHGIWTPPQATVKEKSYAQKVWRHICKEFWGTKLPGWMSVYTGICMLLSACFPSLAST